MARKQCRSCLPTVGGLYSSFRDGSAAARADQKLMWVPIGGGPQQLVPTGPFDEFRCALTPGKRCVLRTIQNRQYVYWDLDPVRGRGKELARTAWTPSILGDWTLSADGAEVAMPNHDPRQARVLLIGLDAPAGRAQATSELQVPGLGDLLELVADAKGAGWFASATSSRGVKLLHIDRSGRFQLLQECPSSTWGVPSPTVSVSRLSIRPPSATFGRLSYSDAAIFSRSYKPADPSGSPQELGSYPEGAANLPVAGVSWFEAAAYAEFMGKELPTVYHWQQAAFYIPISSDVISLSNFAGKGPAARGTLAHPSSATRPSGFDVWAAPGRSLATCLPKPNVAVAFVRVPAAARKVIQDHVQGWRSGVAYWLDVPISTSSGCPS